MMALKLIMGPTTEPVTLAEAKTAIDELTNDRDSKITSAIKAGREAAEDYQNRRYVTQTWELTLDELPELPLKLGDPPLQSVEFVRLYDVDGNETSVPVSDFMVDMDSEPGMITFKRGKSWPAIELRDSSCFKVQFKVGVLATDTAKIPERVKQAICVYVGYKVDGKETDPIPASFYNLLDSDRRVPV